MCSSLLLGFGSDSVVGLSAVGFSAALKLEDAHASPGCEDHGVLAPATIFGYRDHAQTHRPPPTVPTGKHCEAYVTAFRFQYHTSN